MMWDKASRFNLPSHIIGSWLLTQTKKEKTKGFQRKQLKKVLHIRIIPPKLLKGKYIYLVGHFTKLSS